MNRQYLYYQLVPKNVHQDLSRIDIYFKSKIQGYRLVYLFEVISIVAFNIRKKGKPAQLQIKYIKKLVPQGDKYLKGLLELEIIKRSGQYVPGKSSFKYVFSRKYQSRNLSFLLNDNQLILRLKNVKAEYNKEKAKSQRRKFLFWFLYLRCQERYCKNCKI